MSNNSSDEPMLQVKRLAHATLTTPDIEKQIEYYVEVLGLWPIERSKKRAILATCTGFEAIVLEQGDKIGLPRLAFQVAPNSDLGELAAAIKNQGLKVERRSGITPGIADAITFEDPKGTLLEIFSNYDFTEIGGTPADDTFSSQVGSCRLSLPRHPASGEILY